MTIRVLESISTVRLLKLTRYYEGSQLIATAVFKSIAQLLVPLFMLFVMVFFFSMIIYDIEWDASIERCTQLWRTQGVSNAFIEAHGNGVSWGCEACNLAASTLEGNATLQQYCQTCVGYPPGAPECLGLAWTQTFTDMPAALWFTMVTVTTVGYGDLSPTTWRGQLFCIVVILTGIIFLAMPLAIVGNNFTSTFEERALLKLQKMIRQLLVENGMQAADVLVAYHQIDVDGDGLINFQEFVDFCTIRLRLQLPKLDLYRLWRQIDMNGSGVINFSEFTSTIFPNVDIEALAAEAASASEIKTLQAQQTEDEGNDWDDDRAAPGSFVRVPAVRQGQGAGQKQTRDTGSGLLSALRQAKASDHGAMGAQSGPNPTLNAAVNELLSSMKGLHAALDNVAGRMEQIELGQANLKSRFTALDSALAHLVHNTGSPQQAAHGHDADFAEADRAWKAVPTKDAPPNQSSTGQRRRRHRPQQPGQQRPAAASASSPDRGSPGRRSPGRKSPDAYASTPGRRSPGRRSPFSKAPDDASMLA